MGGLISGSLLMLMHKGIVWWGSYEMNCFVECGRCWVVGQ